MAEAASGLEQSSGVGIDPVEVLDGLWLSHLHAALGGPEDGFDPDTAAPKWTRTAELAGPV